MCVCVSVEKAFESGCVLDDACACICALMSEVWRVCVYRRVFLCLGACVYLCVFLFKDLLDVQGLLCVCVCLVACLCVCVFSGVYICACVFV